MCLLCRSVHSVQRSYLTSHHQGHAGCVELSISGHNINHPRYADDIVLLADSIENLQALLDKDVEKSEEYGLSVNKAKTKCTVISKLNTEQCDLKIEEEAVQQVHSFNYLDSLITSDGRSEKEIRRTIGMAKTTFEKMGVIFRNRKLPLETILRILNTYV